MQREKGKKKKGGGNQTTDVHACTPNASLPITNRIEICTRQGLGMGGRRREYWSVLFLGVLIWELKLRRVQKILLFFLGYLPGVVLILFCSSSFLIGHTVICKD
jgi:hypothetical protein